MKLKTMREEKPFPSSWQQGGNVSFLDEAIRGINFFSAQVDSFPYHEWPKATSDLNESTSAEKKLIPRIASSRKGIL